VKKVFAPTPRTERAAFVEPGKTAGESADAILGAIFKRHPALEADMTKLASGF
jgi:electron transfer flavoprotein beta subunit